MPGRRWARRRVLKAAAGLVAGPALPVSASLAGSSRGTPPAVSSALGRIDALIADMTLEEKAGQLSCFSDQIRPVGIAFNPDLPRGGADEQLARIRRGEIGMLFNGVGVSGARAAQDAAVKDSRLKIPLIFAGDIIHGLRTAYPLPLAEACAFDPDLAMRTARAAAEEATALGLHWTFAPMVDVARDQRWGRVAEGSGEDVHLGTRLAVARLRGFQGEDLRDPTSLAACAKHFAGYGAVSGGMEYNYTEISPGTLREVHLPPFEAAVEAGVATIMSAFNDVEGVPASANRWLMTDLLRDAWRFGGLVVGDYAADENLIAHGFAADGRDAAKKAFLAGMDMSMQSDLFNLWLPDLVRAGEVPMERLDAAVRRVLALKEAVGLFDDPYRSLDEAAERTRVATPAMLSLAREAAARSIVLLKNDGVLLKSDGALLKNDGALLPLPADPGRIALIGPFGEDRDNVVGTWAFMSDPGLDVSIAEGLRARGIEPDVAPGCGVDEILQGGVTAAIAAARRSDVAILALGEAQSMSGEAQARTEITIPAPQLALATAVLAVQPRTIVLLRHGRALALEGAVRDAPAILATWFLGSQSGHAIADILFGAVNPSAKLAVSFPRRSGQQPFFYDHKATGRPASNAPGEEYKARYRETKNEALYPFGHGLAYTSFEISGVTVPERMGERLEIGAVVTNRGPCAGAEVVQLYIHDRVASRTRPVRQLKGFERVELSPGESSSLRFTLRRSDLRFWSEDAFVIEPGVFDLWVATDSTNGERRSFVLD
ncbi:beta-glucosidase [Aureimonas sp. Leaf454]|uniref:glycoside hydrolase family 3 N-terminal domain-containing protein n=1 Tax=Aureimonas sp. Leaf454 TaxID=1736381 RepID=UPI0006F814DB|nr:glycoside hydrolase family 3 N-terminal domain-containing protein [Aureimonas sp. Leaf454]KQT46289.1 beta-glucosidase [Aureimonas sp. Leaf454]